MKKIAGIYALIIMASISLTAQAGEWERYRVTITNATAHHVITPPLIVVHNKNFTLFNVAESASDGLVTQAETGDPSALYYEVNNTQGVYDVVAGSDVIVYGNKASYEI
ncbi:MAG: spondin domain-containing protein, partial [Gammaproteobacteria bacterium]|nr:spondin domain-containing protein [Gammaproteobacteria bacterium]